jgi:cell division protease FtsH
MTKETTTIHLADIAGYREEKEEAVKLADILKNFDQYKAKGASIPKGLLLYGEPGVGKTMFAKAISTEAGVPLYEFEADESENAEETIKSLKSLFTKAKETIPSIVFIDELDELVSNDESGMYGFQSDYSRKTLKTLLTEIDGISSSEGILVIATTNRKRGIPRALIRSGRLEKQITFRLPTIEDRVAIAALYLKKAGVEGVNPNDVARKTEGFTGADIKSLINASIIESVRKREEVSLKTIASVIPTIRFGEIKKTVKGGPSDSVCYHEIGHFLTQYGLNGKIASISVEQYGDVAGHVAFEDDFPLPFSPKKDDRCAEEILNSVIVSLGGIAGEEVFLGKRYCGSRSDLSDAIDSIYKVLANGCLGFEYLPNLDIERGNSMRGVRATLPNDAFVEQRSEKYIEILNESLAKAIDFVKSWRPLGELIFPLLKEKESLSREELATIVHNYRKEHIHEVRA